MNEVADVDECPILQRDLSCLRSPIGYVEEQTIRLRLRDRETVKVMSMMDDTPIHTFFVNLTYGVTFHQTSTLRHQCVP